MNIQIGDTVRVWKFVYDRDYSATGMVEKINHDRVHGEMLYVNGDWWVNANDLTNKCELLKSKQPKQRAQLEWESMDISSGFGIGGAGSDDHNMSLERDVMSVNNTGCQWKHGTRYDENCESCGRNSEVCNDCGCCERCHHA